MKIVKSIPESVKGAILMISGLALLFHTLGILTNFLWYALIIISVYLIFIGFIKIRGVEAIKCMIKRKNKEVIYKEEIKPEE
ncbi:hypothetical protein ACFLYU_03665 [Candidatus Dependentiae bacterium]